MSTIYSRAFKPQKVQARKLASSLRRIHHDLNKDFGLGNVAESVQWFLLALANAMTNQPQSVLVAPRISSSERNLRRDLDEGFHPISLALIRLKTLSNNVDGISYEAHVRAEASIAAALVISLQRACPDEDIFVAAPHRIQRQSVNGALKKIWARRAELDDLAEAFEQLNVNEGGEDQGKRRGMVRVDTVERLQGESSWSSG